MATGDTQIVQAAGDLHHQIRYILFGQPQDIFDNPTAFDARYGVFYHNTCRGDDPIQEAVLYTQRLAFGLFWG